MHFDALCTLMDKQEFRNPVSSTLPHGDDPSVHVDFGCGPGTASWAVMNILSNDACVTTIGHDHNPHMIELAHSMTFHVASAMTKTCLSEFYHDWGEFERTVVSLCERRWNTVIVTANSLFGQATMQPSDIEAVIVLIAGICERTRESPVFVAGTHPPSTPKNRSRTLGIASLVLPEPIGCTMIVWPSSPGVLADTRLPLGLTGRHRHNWLTSSGLLARENARELRAESVRSSGCDGPRSGGPAEAPARYRSRL